MKLSEEIEKEADYGRPPTLPFSTLNKWLAKAKELEHKLKLAEIVCHRMEAVHDFHNQGYASEAEARQNAYKLNVLDDALDNSFKIWQSTKAQQVPLASPTPVSNLDNPYVFSVGVVDTNCKRCDEYW